MTYKILTLGCRTNQYESEAYRTQLEALGYQPTKGPADICIVNSCTVTENAARDSRAALRKLQRDNPGAKIALTGCLVEHEKIEGATIIPNLQKEKLIEQLFPDQPELPEFKIERFEAHTRAFVKVQDGCNSFCTYCIIPYVRGRSRSRPSEEILKEIEGLVRSGYKEVVLTGINIGDFEHNLANLVRQVDQIEGLERIRISSIDPDEVDDDLLDAVVNGKKTCNSMHIVLQSGANPILKRMNRKYTRQEFFHTIDRLKEADPDFAFTTDIIVGFPGETEEDHKATIDAMEKVHFSKVHMFPYSDRPRTRANLYPDKVDPKTISRRKQEILRLAEQGSYQLRQGYLGRTLSVLAENNNSGHTTNFLQVEFTTPVRPNTIVNVELIENQPHALVGVPCV